MSGMESRISKIERNIDYKRGSFGEYLKDLRRKKSLRDVSEATGISHSYLSTLERGFDPRTKKERKPSFDVLKKLAAYYGVNYTHLLKLAGYLTDEECEVVNVEKEPNNLFGQELRKIREKKGFSMQELSRLTGVSQPYLSQLETGKNTNPTPQVLAKLSTGLTVDYMYLLKLAGYLSKEEYALTEVKACEHEYELLEKQLEAEMSKVAKNEEKVNIKGVVIFYCKKCLDVQEKTL